MWTIRGDPPETVRRPVPPEWNLIMSIPSSNLMRSETGVPSGADQTLAMPSLEQVAILRESGLKTASRSPSLCSMGNPIGSPVCASQI